MDYNRAAVLVESKMLDSATWATPTLTPDSEGGQTVSDGTAGSSKCRFELINQLGSAGDVQVIIAAWPAGSVPYVGHFPRAATLPPDGTPVTVAGRMAGVYVGGVRLDHPAQQMWVCRQLRPSP